MNNDIKEILVRSKEQQALDDLKALANAKEDEEVYIEYGLNTKAKILLDYITNLQEELEEQKRIEQASLDTINNLQEENERLYKELEKADSITQSCIFEGSRSAGKSYRQCLNWLEDYKSRIDKAIEYIEEDILDNKIEKVNWEFDECHWSDMAAERIKPLIDILQGDDED